MKTVRKYLFNFNKFNQQKNAGSSVERYFKRQIEYSSMHRTMESKNFATAEVLIKLHLNIIFLKFNKFIIQRELSKPYEKSNLLNRIFIKIQI